MVIGEWQWEKFRAFDFLGRFERGRGWEVMGVGEREREPAPTTHLSASGLVSAEVPTSACRSKLTGFAASLFDIVILSPESDIDMLSFRGSIIAHGYQHDFILTPHPDMYRFQVLCFCFLGKVREPLVLGGQNLVIHLFGRDLFTEGLDSERDTDRCGWGLVFYLTRRYLSTSFSHSCQARGSSRNQGGQFLPLKGII